MAPLKPVLLGPAVNEDGTSVTFPVIPSKEEEEEYRRLLREADEVRGLTARRKAQYEKEWETLMPPASSIVPLTNGHLECRNSDCGRGVYWCKHIERFVSDGRDAHDIWAETKGGELILTGVKIQVPYVPTMGQWALVEIGEEFHGNYKVYLRTDSENGNSKYEAAEFLGFFSPGEGRKVLREMVHNWFLPRLTESNECQSSSHSYQAQMEWQEQVTESDPSKKEYLAQCWSVFLKGLCLRCAAADALSSEDDLVPDVSTGRRGWR